MARSFLDSGATILVARASWKLAPLLLRAAYARERMGGNTIPPSESKSPALRGIVVIAAQHLAQAGEEAGLLLR